MSTANTALAAIEVAKQKRAAQAAPAPAPKKNSAKEPTMAKKHKKAAKKTAKRKSSGGSRAKAGSVDYGYKLMVCPDCKKGIHGPNSFKMHMMKNHKYSEARAVAARSKFKKG